VPVGPSLPAASGPHVVEAAVGLTAGPLAATGPWAPVAVVSASLVVTFMALGIVVALLGHLSGIRGLTVGGILVVFAATLGMIAGGYDAWRSSPSPAPDVLRPDSTGFGPDESIGDARRRADQERRRTATTRSTERAPEAP